MRRMLMLLMLGTGLAAGTAALADDDCDRPMRDWQPREAVARKARDIGVTVRRIRTDDGCYKVYGRAADGRAVEIEMDPVTLEILETEYRHDKDRRHPDSDEDDRPRGEDGGGPVPAPPAAQPANPLIGPATGRTN
ncbi:PepSY domain-containing protein [Paracoccus sp. TOH]|uniref:PepSY domain-containing protein n=1 Tax=Paracoccus simplex TaxID=2086346 RepID=A0ABV7RZ37_9RHOB